MKLTPKMQKAINFVAVKHRDQKRKGVRLPYVVHPYSVAWILSNYTKDEDVIVAGLLHDVLEDVKGYYAHDMVKDFGERITEIVKEVSEYKDPNVSEDEKATWKRRKKLYLKNLENDSKEALMICAADKIHNLLSMIDAHQELGEDLWNHFNAPKSQKIWLYGEILNVLKRRLKSPIVKELEKTFRQAIKQIFPPLEKNLK